MNSLIKTTLCGFAFFGLIACSQEDSEAVSSEILEQVSAIPEVAPAALMPALPVVGNPDHASMLASNDPLLAANKLIAYDMWRTLVDGLDIEASKQYIDENYIQHNPIANTGFAGIEEYFSELGEPREIPERIQRPLIAILAEGDLVAMAWVDDRETYTTTIFNMYRIVDSKIVEHWDHGTLPDGMAPLNYIPVEENADHEGALASNDPELMANKVLVYDMWRVLLDAQQVEEAPKYMSEGYIQHNPMANTGLNGFLSFFRQIAQPQPVKPEVEGFIHIVAENDKIILATERTYLDSSGNPYTTTWFDMWIEEDGLLIEHWDTASFGLPAQAP